MWRVYFRTGPYPALWNTFRSFGPSGARFDHHEPPPRDQPVRAILYGAGLGPTCLAEVFQDSRVIDRWRRDPYLTVFQLEEDVSLLDLTGAWITRAGGNLAISSGSRAMAREWSRAIYDAFPDLHGIRYGSSMDANRPAVAFYERARRALPGAPLLDRPLRDPGLARFVSRAAERFGYRVR